MLTLLEQFRSAQVCRATELEMAGIPNRAESSLRFPRATVVPGLPPFHTANEKKDRRTQVGPRLGVLRVARARECRPWSFSPPTAVPERDAPPRRDVPVENRWCRLHSRHKRWP